MVDMERRKSEYRTDWPWGSELREAYRAIWIESIWEQFELARAALNNKHSGPI